MRFYRVLPTSFFTWQAIIYVEPNEVTEQLLITWLKVSKRRWNIRIWVIRFKHKQALYSV